MSDFPIVQDPQTIRNNLVAAAVAEQPGLTTDLPGTLIEDIVSTDVAAILLQQQARQEFMSSLSPSLANLYLLYQLGQVYGVMQGLGSNTSVNVVFTGTPGYIVPKSTIVSDGTYNYLLQSSVVIETGGTSQTGYCVATVSGSWAVPANTVTTISSSIPAGVTLTVTNPNPGTPSIGAQTADQYRQQVMDAGLVACTGTITAIKTYLKAVDGVVDTLISIKQKVLSDNVPILLEVLVGGGDKYAVALALWKSIGNPGVLVGNVLTVSNITNHNPGVVTTNYLHLYKTGDIVTIEGATGISGINGIPFTVTVIDPFKFSIGVDTTSYGTYSGGGVCSPNNRNVKVTIYEATIYDTPDNYTLEYVIPPEQPTHITFTWKSTVQTAISSAEIANFVAQPIVDYVNGISPGGYLNYLELQSIFQQNVAPLLPVDTLTSLVISSTINELAVSPIAGTNVVLADPEGYYFTKSSWLSFVRG